MGNHNSTINLDFVGVGAEKAGTTWLADTLREHPDIYIPKQKELHYFNKKFVEDPSIDNSNYHNSWEWYSSFFTDAEDSQVWGELCPTYLWDTHAPYHIKTHFPQAKIIIVLRSPIERSFSQYLYYRQKGIISETSFEDAIQKNPHLIERSKYASQVKKYLELFPANQILIVHFEEMMAQKSNELSRVEEFLGVKEFYPSNLYEKSNATGLPKYPRLNIFLAKTRLFVRKYNLTPLISISRKTGIVYKLEKFRNNAKKTNTKPAKLSEEQKSHLINYYFYEDIKHLENLLNTNLSAWYPYEKTNQVNN